MKNDKKEAAKAIAASRQAVLDAESAFREKARAHRDTMRENIKALNEFSVELNNTSSRFVRECIRHSESSVTLMKGIIVKKKVEEPWHYEYWQPFYSIRPEDNPLPDADGVYLAEKLLFKCGDVSEELIKDFDKCLQNSGPKPYQEIIELPCSSNQAGGFCVSHALFEILAFFYFRNSFRKPTKKLQNAIYKAKSFIHLYSSAFEREDIGEIRERLFTTAYGKE